MEVDPAALVGKLSKGANSVKFGRGVLGTTGQVMWGLLAFYGVLAIRISSDLLVDRVLGGLAVLGTAAVFAWIAIVQRFSRDYPVQAIMSGTELATHYRDQAQAKGMPELSAGPDEADPDARMLPAPDDADDADG